jgi:lipopolysaccharide assembly outer membrane protein LptD (OstA)
MQMLHSGHTGCCFFSLAIAGFVVCCLFLQALPAEAPAETHPDDSETAATGTAAKTVITIENARSTKYEKSKDSGDDCIFLEGSVRLSVEKNDKKTVISADKITYDRKTEMLYAEGNIILKQTDSTNSGGEDATASSLMFNTSTLEGVFDDGRIVQTQSDSLNLPSGSTLIVASDIFGRSESNAIAFKDGQLTFCDDPDPHWNIKASRIWLLPGGEFAFLNALLYVGIVPIMYFPAFYYPKDELVFHPVFGYEDRDGYFLQTTTYLWGRKPLDTTTTTSTSSSTTTTDSDSDNSDKLKALFNFMKPSKLKDEELQGIMLHNLDADYTGNTTNYYKIIGDWYSNLGTAAGFEGIYKPSSYISDIETSLLLGFSNTVFEDGSTYLPYSPTGRRYYDHSDLLGVELPFRYGANFKFVLSKPLSLTLSLPVYSDPYFSDDFSDRSETMDWISYLTETAAGSDTDDDTVNEISSFTWSLDSSYSLPISDYIKPYVSSVSATLSSSLIFSSMTNSSLSSSDDTWETYTPERKFYYPSQITPVNFSLSWSGTLFTFSSAGTTENNTTGTQPPVPSFVEPLTVPDELKTEKGKEKEKEEAEKTTAGGTDDKAVTADSSETSEAVPDEDEKKDGPLATDLLPQLDWTLPADTSFTLFDYKLNYAVKPAITTQLAYSSTNLDTPEDFDWKNLKSSMYTLKIPVDVDSVAGFGGTIFTIDNKFSFNPVFQAHPYLSTDTTEGGYTETEAAALRLADYTAEKRDLTNTNAISFKPFAYFPHFKESGVAWRSIIKFIRTTFAGDEENPEWDYLTVDWSDEDSITENALDYVFAVTEGNSDEFGQSLTLTTDLSPQIEEYYTTLKLTFPYTVCTVESGYSQTSTTDDTWIKKPLKQSLSVNLFNSTMAFTESYNYNLEDDHNDSLKLALSWQGFQAAYTMAYTTGYDFEANTGWVARDDEEFLPYSLSFAYAPDNKTFYTWKDRVSVSPGISSSLVADMLRPTNSYFLFSPSLSFKISDFLTFTFSSTSKNSVLYRYVQKYIGEDGLVPGEENIFVDLINSFRFDNETLRRESGFKLKSLNFTLTHDLHDWDFNTTFKLEPRLITDTSKKYYDFNPYMTIAITWRPMDSMKTEIRDKYGDWQLNP